MRQYSTWNFNFAYTERISPQKGYHPRCSKRMDSKTISFLLTFQPSQITESPRDSCASRGDLSLWGGHMCTPPPMSKQQWRLRKCTHSSLANPSRKSSLQELGTNFRWNSLSVWPDRTVSVPRFCRRKLLTENTKKKSWFCRQAMGYLSQPQLPSCDLQY